MSTRSSGGGEGGGVAYPVTFDRGGGGEESGSCEGEELTFETAYADMTSEGIAMRQRPVIQMTLHRPYGVMTGVIGFYLMSFFFQSRFRILFVQLLCIPFIFS